MTTFSESTKEQLRAELERRGLQIPPTGGSGVTRECRHDFVFLRTEMMQRAGEGDRDVFYCRHCLVYREVKRS